MMKCKQLIESYQQWTVDNSTDLDFGIVSETKWKMVFSHKSLI